jgi:DNA-binding transcriptional ArsR family regulator
VGADTIDAAAGGDPDATALLLGHDRYYGGVAREALERHLAQPPEEGRSAIVEAVDAVAAAVPGDTERLAGVAAGARERLAVLSPAEAVEVIAAGYRYTPEPEAARVVVMPHLGAPGTLVLAQHREARLIVAGPPPSDDPIPRLLRIGEALGEERRLQILALLAGGCSVGEIVDATGLARSTVHHHIAGLRRAGLLRVEGNARAYRYAPRAEAAAEFGRALSALLSDRRSSGDP